jgi:hypothetical protein
MATANNRSRKPQSGPVRVIQTAASAEQTAEQITTTAAEASQEAPPVVAEAPSYDLAFLDALENETWEAAPSRGRCTVQRVADPDDRPKWDPVTVAAAAAIGFSLPETYPSPKERKCADGSKRYLPWRLVGMPRKLEALSLPVGALAKPASRVTVKIIDDIVTGWNGKVPSLAAGESLPLVYVLKLFASPNVRGHYETSKQWKCLRNEEQAHITLLYAMAERLGRYVYVEDGMIKTADETDAKRSESVS